MTYPSLNASDTEDLQTLFSFANRASDYLFMPVMLLVIWFVWVIGATFTGRPIYRAIMYASFLCSIIATTFVLMNWLSTSYMYFLFLLTAVGAIWTKLAESYS